MTLDQLARRIRAHDHFYEYSEDMRDFRKGQVDRMEIVEELKRLPGVDMIKLVKENVPLGAVPIWLRVLARMRA